MLQGSMRSEATLSHGDNRDGDRDVHEKQNMRKETERVHAYQLKADDCDTRSLLMCTKLAIGQ